MRGLQIRAGFRDYKSWLEGLQIGAALGISSWGKKITNRGKESSKRGKDYKSGQEGFQIGARIPNWDNDYKLLQNSFCGMVDRRKVFSLISSVDQYQRI